MFEQKHVLHPPFSQKNISLRKDKPFFPWQKKLTLEITNIALGGIKISDYCRKDLNTELDCISFSKYMATDTHTDTHALFE